MFQMVMNAIMNEPNEGTCRRGIANHWLCRCTVPEPGMRAAGELLVRRDRENGVADTELIHYPADDRTEWLDGKKTPLEWRPRSAELRIVQPLSEVSLLCCYADEPLCLVSNSAGTCGCEARLAPRDGDSSQ